MNTPIGVTRFETGEDEMWQTVSNTAGKLGEIALKEGAKQAEQSGMDAAMKILRLEGPQAFFKGWFAHYLRGAPHVALIFVFLEQLKKRKPIEYIFDSK